MAAPSSAIKNSPLPLAGGNVTPELEMAIRRVTDDPSRCDRYYKVPSRNFVVDYQRIAAGEISVTADYFIPLRWSAPRMDIVYKNAYCTNEKRRSELEKVAPRHCPRLAEGTACFQLGSPKGYFERVIVKLMQAHEETWLYGFKEASKLLSRDLSKEEKKAMMERNVRDIQSLPDQDSLKQDRYRLCMALEVFRVREGSDGEFPWLKVYCSQLKETDPGPTVTATAVSPSVPKPE